MTYNQMIHEYLDAGLSQPQEDALFQAMATDQSLRVDFNQQLSIMKIASNDMSSISPPIEATNAVFSSLGFSLPSNGSAPIVKESNRKPGASIFASASGVGILNIFKDNLSTFASIGIAALISTFLFMTFNNDLPTNGESNNFGITLAQNYYDDASHSEIPVVSSSDVSNQTITNKSNFNRSNSLNNNPIVSAESNQIASNSIMNNNNKSDENSNLESNSLNQNKNQYNNLKINENGYAIVKVNRLSSSDNSSPALLNPIYSYEEMSGFAIEMRGGKDPNQDLVLNDMMIGVNFEFYDDFYALGLIGNEHYLVRTSNPLFEGEEVQYANESMVSFKLGLRYAPDDLILQGLIVPYIQATGGGISNGFAGGMETGLMLNLNSNYTFMLGYSKQFAKYNFEGNLYNSNKNLLNFGIRYSF